MVASRAITSTQPSRPTPIIQPIIAAIAPSIIFRLDSDRHGMFRGAVAGGCPISLFVFVVVRRMCVLPFGYSARRLRIVKQLAGSRVAP